MLGRTAFFRVPLVVFVFGVGVVSGQTALTSTIENLNKKFIDAFAKGDMAGLAAMYSEDAEVFPAGSDVVKGRPAIQDMWKSVLDSGIAGAELTTRRVDEAGMYAIETGAYVMKLKDGGVGDRGKYVVVWKRIGPQWLIYRDIWTTSMPTAGK